MTLREFFAAYQGWQKIENERTRSAMERARWVAGVIISPWVKGNRSINEMLPLPWDNPMTEKPLDYDPNDIEARRRRVAEILTQL